MIYESTVPFVTTRSRSKLVEGTKYFGKIVHRRRLSKKDIIEGLAKSLYQHEPITEMFVNGLLAYMAEQLSQGYRLDFGDFSAELTVKGGFPSANAPFDPARNQIDVAMQAKKGLLAAVEKMKLENETAVDGSRIHTCYQKEPDMGESQILSSDGRRTITTNGHNVMVDASAPDEGAWIETRDGKRLLTGEIFNISSVHCDFYLEGHLDPGEYWLVICSRGETPELLRSQLLVRVV